MTALDRALIRAFAEAPNRATTAAIIRGEPVDPAPAPAAPLAPRLAIATFEEHEPAAAQQPAAADVETYQARPKSMTAPLSSFAAQVRTTEAPRPKVEVDELAWPQACGDLLSRSRHAWDKFADHMSERINAEETCVALTGCSAACGRTTLALTLARHLATRGVRVALVDADFNHSALAKACCITPQVGWADVVNGEHTLDEAMIVAVADGVSVIPCCGRIAATTPPRDEVRIAATFETLKEQFDLVLVDAGSLVDQSAAQAMAALAKAMRIDAAYLVRDARVTTLEQMTTICTGLRRAGLNVAGRIDNFVGPAELGAAHEGVRVPHFAGRLLALARSVGTR
ncbi:MAG: tyrosine-protein kinase family protein [Pirellulales bacterium]